MKYFLLPVLFFLSINLWGQADSLTAPPDSVRKDSVLLVKDTITRQDSTIARTDSVAYYDSLQKAALAADSVSKRNQQAVVVKNETKEGDHRLFSGKEYLFYYLLFLLLLFGLLRMAFSKYFNDLFRVFFRTTLKTKQVREQLLQSPLPSVFMNGFFVLSAGLYINFLLQHFQLSVTDNFWLQYIYCAAALSVIYFLKFTGLKITGWIFNAGEAADAYIFIVFVINKMLGIFLLPFLVLLAFSGDPLYSNALVLSWAGAGLLYGYRFILSYGAARNEIKLNPFHFILYIIAFEIIPLLLIYKLLLMIF